MNKPREFFSSAASRQSGFVYNSVVLIGALWTSPIECLAAKRPRTRWRVRLTPANSLTPRSFFYFRDPQYAEARGGGYLPDEATRPTRQDALKQTIKAVCEAKHIPLRENYGDPSALVKLVLKDLTDAIDAQFPAGEAPDVWGREDRDLSHFNQALSEARAERIAAVEAASNPLYIKALLDDLPVTGVHARLDEQIDGYLSAADIPALLSRILARWEGAYERDRKGLVGEALALLWAARRGLTEPELLELLKPDGLERLPAGLWSPVRRALEDGLVDRDGVLAFAHDHLRAAVGSRYEDDPPSPRARAVIEQIMCLRYMLIALA